MAVAATVTAGKIFQDGESVTVSELNKLGTPTVDISGAVGTLSLTDGSVTNAKVASAAGIQLDKIQSGSAAQVVVANSSGVPTYVALSGDATISDAGALTLAADSVVTADITDLNVTTGKLAANAVTAGKLDNLLTDSGGVAGSYTKADLTLDSTGRVTAAASNTTTQTARVEGFTGSGTWTSPSGVTRAKFTIVGGGGNAAVGSGSGGAGSTVIASVAVTASTAYSVSVGAASGTSSVVVGAITYSAGGGSASSGSTAGAGGTAGANGDIRLDGRSGIRFSSGGEMSPEIPAPVISHYGTGGLSAQSGSIQTNGQPGIVIVEWME
jgi:hypothetical protein